MRVVIALFGPIFAKESYETARAGRYHLFRIIYVTALLVSFWLVWLVSTALSRGGFSTLKEVAEAGNGFFTPSVPCRSCANSTSLHTSLQTRLTAAT